MNKNLLMLAATLLTLLWGNVAQAATCTTLNAGSWNTAARWSCGRVPRTGDTVIVAHNVTMNVDVAANQTATSFASLTINNGATLADDGNGRVLTVTNTLVVNGTVSNGLRMEVTGAAATISGAGTLADTRLYTSGTAVTVAAGSTLNFTGGARLYAGRTEGGNTVTNSVLTINGTLNSTVTAASTTFLRLYGNSTVIGTTGVINAAVSAVSYNTATAAVTNNGSVSVNKITQNAAGNAWTQGANSNLTLGATSTVGTLSASATGNRVTYNSPATPIGGSYYHISGSGICPLPPNVIIVAGGSSPCTVAPGSGFVLSSPSTCSSVTGVGTIPWTLPLNAIASDDVRARAVMLANSTSNYLNCTGFNFAAIPTGSTINGITVYVERWASRSRRSKDAFVYLIKGGVVGTAFNGATATQYTTQRLPEVVEPHGGMSTLWGSAWTDADVKAANFGVAYAATTTRNLTVDVDHISVRVDYTMPGDSTPSGFNVYDTGTTPTTTLIGNIGTKIAGQAFSLDIAAINPAGTAMMTTGFAGSIKVELLNAADSSGTVTNGCNSTWTNLQTLPTQTFTAADAGRHRVSNITVSNAHRDVRVKVTYPATGTPTKVGCSTDNFAVRPSHLGAISAKDADWQTAGAVRTLNNNAATGGVVHKAGQPFSLAASAYNTANQVTSNYTGSPMVIATTISPVGGVNGALTFAQPLWLADNAGGVSNDTAEYDEAGVIQLMLEDHEFAAVDSGDGTAGSCAGYYVCSTAPVTVGRFVPDHFELKDASVNLAANPTYDPLVDSATVDTWLPTAVPQFKTFNTDNATCANRSFTYIGQPFAYVAPPKLTVKAMDANGGAVQNYDQNRFDPNTPPVDVLVSQTYAVSGGTLDVSRALGALTLAPNANYAGGSPIVGTVTLNAADMLAFTRDAAVPVEPFSANINLTLDVTDSSEAAVAGNGVITAAPQNFAIPFDAGNEMRYGRLELSNAYGSELLDLKMPISAKYYSGGRFVANGQDHCTLLSSVTLSNPSGQLSASNMPASHAGIAGVLQGGKGNILLQKPTPVATGHLDVTLGLSTDAAWLLPAPTARATFGVYKGNNTFIYRGRRGR